MDRSNIHPSCSKTLPPIKQSYAISEQVSSILESAKQLKDDDYFALCCELIKRSPCTFEHRRMIKNCVIDNFKVDCKARTSEKGIRQGVEDFTGQQRIVDPSTSRPLGDSESVPASQVPLICRGDLIAKATSIFFDTEKVIEAKTHANVSGDFAAVDRNGNLLFWCYFNQLDVCKYHTKMTGLSASKMQRGLCPQELKAILEKTMQGKVLYGAASKNDMLSLGLDPSNLPFELKDIQEFFKDVNNQPISLSRLSTHFIGGNLQGTIHSSITDARLTAICFRRMEKLRALGCIRFQCPAFENEQNHPKKIKNPGWEVKCTCGVNKKAKSSNKKQFSNLHGFNMTDFE